MADLPWTWFGIRASGITAWALLTAVVIWGLLIKTRILGRIAPPARLLDLHRWLGAIALAFLFAHLGLLLVDPSVHFSIVQILVPGLAPWQTSAVALGTVALWLLIPVSVIGRMRARMGQAGNRWFKRSHLVAYAAWPFATAHYVLAGTDALAQWSLAAIFTGAALIVVGLLARGFVPAPSAGRTPAPIRHDRPRRRRASTQRVRPIAGVIAMSGFLVAVSVASVAALNGAASNGTETSPVELVAEAATTDPQPPVVDTTPDLPPIAEIPVADPVPPAVATTSAAQSSTRRAPAPAPTATRTPPRDDHGGEHSDHGDEHEHDDD